MDNDNYLQLELFHNKEKVNQENHLKGSFLSYIKNYEKFILFAIAFLLIGIVAYCLGVEQGKKISALTFPIRRDFTNVSAVKQEVKSNVVQRPVVKVAQPVEEVGNKVVAVKPVVVVKNSAVVPVANADNVVSSSTGKFTIQLGSFKSKTHAQKYIEELKSQGYAPMLLNKGQFSILCIGNFQNAETANSLLTELRKKYKDCYIRRL